MNRFADDDSDDEEEAGDKGNVADLDKEEEIEKD